MSIRNPVNPVSNVKKPGWLKQIFTMSSFDREMMQFREEQKRFDTARLIVETGGIFNDRTKGRDPASQAQIEAAKKVVGEIKAKWAKNHAKNEKKKESLAKAQVKREARTAKNKARGIPFPEMY